MNKPLETQPAPLRKRFQFSLRTLMLVFLGAGLCVTVIKQAYENACLSSENRGLRAELGYISIGDPSKIWACGSKRISPLHHHFQIFIPADMTYRIGIDERNIPDQGYNADWTQGFSTFPGKKGEILSIDVDVHRNADNDFDATLSSGGSAMTIALTSTGSKVWPGSFFKTQGLDQYTREFGMDEPFDLVRITANVNSPATTHPTGGLVVFFVPNCSNQYPFGPPKLGGLKVTPAP